MSVSLWVSHSLDMDLQNTPLLLSTTEGRWILSLDFATDLIKQYEAGFDENDAYSLGESILIRLNSKNNSSEFIGQACECCDETIKNDQQPIYSVHKTFDDIILFHRDCFPEFVKDARDVIHENSHIYTTNNI